MSSQDTPETLTEPESPAPVAGIDAVETEAVQDVPPVRRSGLGLVAAALLLGGAGTALAWYDPLGWRGENPLQAEITALATRLDASDSAGKALADRLAALESAPEPLPGVSPEDLAALAAAVKANEMVLAELKAAPALGDEVSAVQVAALAEAVDQLKQQVAGLGNGPSDADAIKTAVDAALAERAVAQENEAKAAVEAAQQQAARIEAVEQLRRAARTGAPFADLLPALDGLPLAPVLTEAADRGLVTQQALAEAFPAAARKALDSALRAETGDGIGERLYSFLRIQTGARSLEPREGNDPDAVLSRAEAAVQSGQVQVALDELAALPPEAQAEMADWTVMAQGWLAAEQGLAELAAAVGVQGG